MCTLEKNGNLFILTLTGDDQHRLNPNVISSILSALSNAKAQSTHGSVLITRAEGKFFSHGVDLDWVRSGGSKQGTEELLLHFVELLKKVVTALLNLPMPTIAAVTGPAIASGLILALSHDYVIMDRDQGILHMPELDIGLSFPDYFMALFRGKVGSASARRDLLLRGLKMKGEEAEKRGIVEAAYDSEGEVSEASVRLGEDLAKRKWNGEVYAEIRKGLYSELRAILGLSTKVFASARL